ncbi:MAG: hypothetical protein K2N29_00415, partial [Ruminiclostridium sp.]|nr:hypothetical protein [Ruminiclostridium sp.]
MGAVFFVGAVIVGIILIGLFVIGVVFLIVGIVRKRKPRNAGKKAPAVCIASGAVCLLLSISMIVSLTGSFVIPFCT